MTPVPARAVRRAAALLAALCLVLMAAPVPARAEGEAPKVLLMLDASGSMRQPDPSGTTKIAAAQQALLSSLEAMPSSAQVGLRVYGADSDGKPAPSACSDSRLVHPVQPLDKAALTTAVQSFAPRGDTPIAYALQQGAQDLGPDGLRHIILVSDGEETCDPDPCATIKKLVTSGVGIQIDTVGFGVDDRARSQLACIAQVAGGTYYNAASAKALTATLRTLGARAARPFTVAGTPVRGTSTVDAAPVLTLGQYTDVTTSAADEATTYYKVRRTVPGSTLRFSYLTRIPAATHDAQSSWSYTLQTDSGVECDSQTILGTVTHPFGLVRGYTMLALPLDPEDTGPTDQQRSCAQAESFVAKIERGPGKEGTSPVEIRVVEEPPVANLPELPRGVAGVPHSDGSVRLAPSGTRQPVTGGAGFNDAPEITPGTYTASLVPGEMVFFKVRLGYGQSAVFADHGLTVAPGTVTQPGAVFTADAVYAPDMSRIVSLPTPVTEYDVTSAGATPKTAEQNVVEVPEVRYRNRWDSARSSDDGLGFSMSGDYYYAMTVEQSPVLGGQPVEVSFSVKVSGTTNGEPASGATVQTSGSSGSAAPAPASSGPAGSPSAPASRAPGSGWLRTGLVGGGVVLVLGGVSGAVWAFLRRR